MARNRSRRGHQQDREQHVSRGPDKLGNILADLMVQRGYARRVAASAFWEAWKSATEPRLHQASRPGNVRRGVLEVTVKNSIVMQELTFQKRAILKRMNAEIAGDDKSIRDIRFRIGTVD